MISPLPVSEIEERIVAIVQFGVPAEHSGLRPAEYYQVTIDPELFSPCGLFVRFGCNPGDELVGWQCAEKMHVVSVLAKWPREVEHLELNWGLSPALTDK